MPEFAIRLLGPFQVTIDSQPVTGFAYDKVRALLAYLAVEADHIHRRETLAALFWPNHSPKLARQNLRQSLATLRRAIKDQHASPPVLLIDGDTVQFNYSGQIWLDVAAFQAHLQADGHVHPNADIETCPSCSQHLKKAIALYRGEFLADLLLGDCDEFETWAVTYREHFHIQALTAMYYVTRYYLRRGEYNFAQTYALHQIKLAPYQEEAHRQLMHILARTGQRSAALAQYETCRRILTKEFGVEPSPQTQALYKRIRSAEKRCPG
jgi:DNA-binding SARP family transcriptional activator